MTEPARIRLRELPLSHEREDGYDLPTSHASLLDAIRFHYRDTGRNTIVMRDGEAEEWDAEMDREAEACIAAEALLVDVTERLEDPEDRATTERMLTILWSHVHPECPGCQALSSPAS